MTASDLYIPPKPLSLWSVVALARVMWKGDGNLLELLPAAAYHFDVGNLGYSRRSTVLFNQPEAVREIMRDADGVFPKVTSWSVRWSISLATVSLSPMVSAGSVSGR